MSGRFTADDVRRTFKVRDAWWTTVLVDPLAAPVIRLLANRTRVTPNQLSVLAFAFGLGAAGAFLAGGRLWLVAGGVLFYLAFYIDCMDGKIARLKGTGSTWGQWMDFIFDRFRIFFCMLALVLGQYLQTGDALYLIVGVCAVFVESFRYINSAHSESVRQDMRARISDAARRSRSTGEAASAAGEPLPFIEDVLTDNPHLDPDEVAEQGEVVDLQQGFRSRFGFYNRFRHVLRRWRIRPHLFSGIEFQMFTCVVAPITGLVIPVVSAACVLLLLFEAVLVYKLRLQVRDFDRAMASYAEADESAPTEGPDAADVGDEAANGGVAPGSPRTS